MVGGVQNKPQTGTAAQVGAANRADAVAHTGELNGRQVRQEQALPRQGNFLSRAFHQVRNFLSRLLGGAVQQPAQTRNLPRAGNEQAQAVGDVQRQHRAPKPLSRQQVQDNVMRQIAFGSHEKFSAAAAIHETGREGYANHQEDVINKNPVMGQVIDKFHALNNEQPEQFRILLQPQNRDDLINQAIVFAGQIQRGEKDHAQR